MIATDIDEPIEVAPWNPEWTPLFMAERDRLLSGIGKKGVIAIEHFGSTAVPDLCAKPIIDLMVGVAPWPPDPALRVRFSNLGYEDLGEAGVPGRIYFRRRASHAYNLALVAHGGPLWIDNLAVRELLRSKSDVRREYEAAKRTAVDAGAGAMPKRGGPPLRKSGRIHDRDGTAVVVRVGSLGERQRRLSDGRRRASVR